MTRAEAYWILEEIRKESFSADYAEALGIAQETIEFVDLMPTDTVPVVRCKDCKHFFEKGGVLEPWCDWNEARLFDGDGFCSDGERKDGDGK